MRPVLRWLRGAYRRVTPRFLKRWVPTSLFGRSLLIIILPIVLMQTAVAYAFFEAEWRTMTAQLSESLASDVAWNVALYEQEPDAKTFREITQRAERTQSLSIALQPGRALPTGRYHTLIPPLDEALRAALDDKLSEPVWLDTTRYPGLVDIRVAVKGGVLRILAPRERAFASRGHVFLLWLALATLTLAGVAIIFIRNQVRAIERLAAAADAFGKGAEVGFKPYGAREVRQAGFAFLAMKDRIQRHIDQRTMLLASVSHDLRTPLTRLKLEAALAEPSPRVDAIKRDIDEMGYMIDEFLAFARGEGGEALAPVDLGRLVQEVADSARRSGACVELEIDNDGGLTIGVRPNAMKRALSNLVMNAASHGAHVAVGAHRRPSGRIDLVVDDDGPGIPPERYEDAFRPFSRLDDSRNQNDKGVGLGLAIARDVARSHGGDVTLDRAPLGGLRAVLRLPG